MYRIPEQNDILEQVGQFIGGTVVNAAAIAAAIGVIRSGVKDPKIIMGAFSLYASANRGQVMNCHFKQDQLFLIK